MAGKQVIDVTTNRRHLEGLGTTGIGVGLVICVVGIILALIMNSVAGDGGHSEDHGDHSAATHEAGETHTDGHDKDAGHTDGHDGGEGAGGHGGGHGGHGYIDQYHWLHSYLMNFCYFTGIALAALFFVLLHHLAKAGWSTVVRRLAEGVAANIILMGLLSIPLLLWGDHVWLWLVEGAAEHDALLKSKEPFLNKTAWVVFTVAVFGIWSALVLVYRHFSIRQDVDGDVKHTHVLQKIAPPAMIFFALSITFFAFYYLMSLDAHWFSTIFGVLFFGGSLMAFMAFLTILCVILQKQGLLSTAITNDHYHDMGKLMFAFMVFWTYCAFSQYMLIWYGNIPEETGWFLLRQGGEQSIIPFTSDPTGWITFSLLFFVGHFFVPFFCILSRHVKRSKTALSVGAGWILFIHWVDMYYLVMPHVRSEHAITEQILIDVAFFLGIGGLFVAGTVFWLRQASLIAEKDPRLTESLAFENV